MALNREEEEFMEMYHQRMADIQNVSDFIAIANTQLNKVLQRIGWNKAGLIKKVVLISLLLYCILLLLVIYCLLL